MGEVACEHSDKVIFTSDNPRTEDPMQILVDMETGLPVSARRKYISIPDRAQAIKTAISMAQPEDIVLIAGKGHEKYQEINGVKHHFDDKEVVQEMFELLGK
jgi:UDP-N-acetylmuramoyl-L-alanyl-D-glutamate--2,6-diaminopimelate ligase